MLLGHQKKETEWFSQRENRFFSRNGKNLKIFYKLQSIFHPSCPQPNTIIISVNWKRNLKQNWAIIFEFRLIAICLLLSKSIPKICYRVPSMHFISSKTWHTFKSFLKTRLFKTSLIPNKNCFLLFWFNLDLSYLF